MSKASGIAAELSTRLATILIANGYNTDIGANTFRGRTSIDADQMPCSVLYEGDDTREAAVAPAGLVKLSQKYTISAHLACDSDHPNDAAHLAIADMKKAVFGTDLRFENTVFRINYNGRTISPRPDGTAFVSAAIEISLSYSEDLKSP